MVDNTYLGPVLQQPRLQLPRREVARHDKARRGVRGALPLPAGLQTGVNKYLTTITTVRIQ